MNRCRFLSSVAAVLLAGSTRVGAAPVSTPVPHGTAPAAARGKQLRQEIKILEARMRAAQPEFEREQHAWEGDVLQQSGTAEKSREVPASIMAILALEPTEREPAQREEVAAYFRPRSKTLGGLWKQLAAKRAALAATGGGTGKCAGYARWNRWRIRATVRAYQNSCLSRTHVGSSPAADFLFTRGI